MNKIGTLGKGVLAVTLIMLLLGAVFIAPAGATDARRFIYELHVYKVRALTTDPVGEIDFAGTPVINFEATPNITYLTNVSQLSSWQNAGSGQSYYQASAGETVIVDPWSINESGGSLYAFSGVTVHAPLATAANTERIFKVELSASGASGYATSGATPVYVHGAPSSGVTDFRYTSRGNNLVSGNNVQNIQISSGVTNYTPDAEISVLGDSKTWRLLYNSSVSAYVIAETNM